jgi:hypothetical protein
MRRAIPGARASLVLRLAALAGLGAGGASGCGGCRNADDRSFERELAAQLTEQLGAGAKVRCSADAPRCTATIAGEALPVALTIEEGQVRWRLDGLVISGPELERQVAAELAALGVQARPSCGGPWQAVEAEGRVACSLSELGVAWATVHADGSYTLELALGAAQEARTHQVDEAELDELSGALDREQGTDDDEEGEASAEGAAPAVGAAPASPGGSS